MAHASEALRAAIAAYEEEAHNGLMVELGGLISHTLNSMKDTQPDVEFTDPVVLLAVVSRLSDVVRQNQGTWSGGNASALNVEENLTASAALKLQKEVLQGWNVSKTLRSMIRAYDTHRGGKS